MTNERSEYTGREIVDVIEEVDLYDANGDKVGDVLEISPEFIVVDTGAGEPQRIPVSQTTQMDNGRDLQLVGGGSAGYETSGSDYSGSDYATAGTVTGSADYASTGTSSGQGGETISVPVHEEELYATKRVEEAGEVEIRKNVVEEERTITVPVMREEVEVVRRPVQGSEGYGTASTDAFQETSDTIRVPVHEEVVEVTKTPRVVEEVELRKTVHQDTEQVSDTVRREEVEVVEGAGSGSTSGGYASSGTSGYAGTSGGYGTSGSTSGSGGDSDPAGTVGGGAAGALGGAAVGGAIGGPVGAVVGGVGGAVLGGKAGDEAEDAIEGDETKSR